MSKRIALTLLSLSCAGIFTSLGIWQLERREWKLNLIAQTEHNLNMPAIAAPPPAQWASINSSNAYSRVETGGYYLPNKNTFVLAVTQLGRGAWVLTPLQTDNGFTILINRGFVADEQRNALETPSTHVQIKGLLRLTEPEGAFLRTNKPEEGKWYSRDVNAITKHQALSNAAPYFIDADASAQKSFPVGGLTVVTFRNSHLTYALTWFALALMSLGGLAFTLLQRIYQTEEEN